MDRNLGIIWTGPVFNHSGYAEELRSYIVKLSQSYDIRLVSGAPADDSYLRSMPRRTQLQFVKLMCNPIKARNVIAILHIPAYAFRKFSDVAYHIGRTMFETDTLPVDWIKKCNLMDEIWVPTSFNAHTFRSAGVKKPLFVIPPGVDTLFFDPTKTKALPIKTDRKFRFLSVFQWIYRKGWDVLIRAWVEAFTANDDVCLLLRTYPYAFHDDRKSKQYIRQAIKKHLKDMGLTAKDIAPIILLNHIKENQMPSLYKSAHAFVLPSRGEAYGRTYLEAMAMELPTIGTRWSGNLDFMNDDNSYLIETDGLETVTQVEPCFKFYMGHKWAKPSWRHLAEILEYVVKNYDKAIAKGKQARRDIVKCYEITKVCEKIKLRLQQVEKQLGVKVATRLHVTWEGPIHGCSSFASVNREICSRLAKKYHLSIVTRNNTSVEHTGLEKYLSDSFPKQNDIHVSHQWPPRFIPHEKGHFVLMQPWEFGLLPKSWIVPIKNIVDEVWVYSKYVWKAYVRSGISPDQLAIVPLGINSLIFNRDPKKCELPTKNKFVFLFVGGTIWRKGVDLLLEAYTEEFSPHDDVALVIKDTGIDSFYRGRTYSIQIRRLQQNPTLPEILYLTKTLTLTEMANLYRACHCLVHPYRGEGFCLPVLEAMACGIPVIVTRGGATDDFCKEEWAYLIPARSASFSPRDLDLIGDHGLILEPDKESLKSIMRYVYDNYQEAQEKANLAHDYVLSNFTWEKVIAIIEKRISDLRKKPIRRFKIRNYLNLDELCLRGEEAFHKGKIDEATNIFAEILHFNPTHIRALNNLAIIYWEEGKLKEALRCLQEAIKLNPEDKDVVWNIGQILLQMGRLKDAYHVYESYSMKHPGEKDFQELINELKDFVNEYEDGEKT